MEVDNYEADFGSLNSLVHFKSLNKNQIESQPMEDLFEEFTVDMNNVKLSTREYKKYGADQIEKLIKMLLEEGLSVLIAAKVCDIPRSSAYRMMDEFNNGDRHVLPGTKKLPSLKNFDVHDHSR
ncbi:MAG: hypothetical protein EXX96DRAFT_546660 [Benjaminiella poitrasii]|nr:MAG: hypothetical protein EXX96DRAFT_546660 [Benjaminiella poitrasii]